MGNVVGSNIFNVLFILGVSAVVAPLAVSSRLIRIELPLMIVASLGLFGLGYDGQISRLDGALLFAGLMVYIYWCIRQARQESNDVRREFAEALPDADVTAGRRLPTQFALIAIGLGLLIAGSRWLVSGGVQIATHLGISELIIGLTIVAVGTSLPEVATSVLAACRGEREIAVGNVVGSNLFNILCVLGLTGVFAVDGLEVSTTALGLDIPVMIGVAAVCVPMFATGHVVARWEGVLLLAYYVAYTSYLIVVAMEVPRAGSYRWILVGGILLTMIPLILDYLRQESGPQ